METLDSKILTIRKREVKKKSSLKESRRLGWIPVVCYGKGENYVLECLKSDFLKIFSKCSYHIPLQLVEADGLSLDVLIKSYEVNTVTKDIIHVDFIRIIKNRILKTSVPILTQGTAKGIRLGGIQEQKLHQLTIKADIDCIPEYIKVDVENLDVRDSIYVRSLNLDPKVKILNPLSQLIVTISPSRATRIVEAEKIKAKTKSGKAADKTKIEKKPKTDQKAKKDEKAKRTKK